MDRIVSDFLADKAAEKQKEDKEQKKPKCYNCKFATEGFKVGDLTHHHCLNPINYPDGQLEAGEVSPWDTLREWWSTCNNHQIKEQATEQVAQ